MELISGIRLPTALLMRFTIASVLVVVVGCASTSQVASVATLSRGDGAPMITLMPLDVELSILTAAGLQEPQSEWTQKAMAYITTAVKSELSDRNAGLQIFDEPSDDPESNTVQLEKLHQAIGFSALYHHLGPMKLPAKQGKFDWTLGPDARELKLKTGADYALFIFIRDSYASAGRVAMQVGAALLGVGVTGGMQVGFASLVDLENGDVVWFNRLVSGSGDLREAAPAAETVESLLDSLPSA